MRQIIPPLCAALGCAAACVTALCAPQAQQKQQPARPAAPATQPAATTRPAPLPLYVGQKPDEWTSYQAMHAYYLDRFVKGRGFGLERLITMNDPRFRKVYADATRYAVGTVQLVSLNDGHKPFVYETPLDADKQRIKHARHVDATDAEVAALRKLQAGDEVVLTGAGKGRELVGAIRATADCTKCHGVKEGTLLGAFRYPLVALLTVENPDGGTTEVPTVTPVER